MSIVFKLLKRIVAVFFALIILFVVVILAWRIFSSGNPKSMETLHADRRLADLYESKGEDMYMFRQEQRSITSGEKNYGYKTFSSPLEYENAVISLFKDEALPLVRESVSALVYTQISDVEDETNGFITYDRRVVKVNKERFRSVLDELYAAVKK